MSILASLAVAAQLLLTRGGENQQTLLPGLEAFHWGMTAREIAAVPGAWAISSNANRAWRSLTPGQARVVAYGKCRFVVTFRGDDDKLSDITMDMVGGEIEGCERRMRSVIDRSGWARPERMVTMSKSIEHGLNSLMIDLYQPGRSVDLIS